MHDIQGNLFSSKATLNQHEPTIATHSRWPSGNGSHRQQDSQLHMVNRSISLVKIRNRFKQVKSLKVPIQFGIQYLLTFCVCRSRSCILIHYSSLFFIKLLVNVPTLARIPRSSQIFNKSHYTVRAIRYQSGRRSALAPFRSRNPPVSPPIGATLSSRTIWRIVWVVGSLLLGGKVASGTRGFHMFSPHNIT